MMRLDQRDRMCIMHLLERRKLLNEPTIYRRFFEDSISYRLDKVRSGSRDFVGLTRMGDDMGKFPDPREHDPYADPTPIEPVDLYIISNPLLIKAINESCDDATRKEYVKLFKKCISAINRSRPKMVIACGYIDQRCRKLLAKISDTIPVVTVDGSHYFSFWHSGIQCLALQTSTLKEASQDGWLREELEQCRMARNLLFVFCDSDPRDFDEALLKYIVRGKAQMIIGVTEKDDEGSFEVVNFYSPNEMVDDISVKSTDSEEDDTDRHMTRLVGSRENGLRVITMTERDTWKDEFRLVDLS